jgi:glyoxylase-like metal-dependent hydrolase (beta-lactamase superfamily II)
MPTEAVADRIWMIDSPYHGRTGVLSTYVIRGERSAIIDPGPAPQIPGVLEALQALGVTRLEYILLTHIHLDHAAGCWKMLEAYPDATIHCHPRGAGHVVDPSKLLDAAREAFGESIVEYGEVRGVPRNRVVESADGEVLDLGGICLETIWSPGHSSHSQSYNEPDSGVVFVGDVVGHFPGNEGVLIPAAPPPHNPERASASIDKLIGVNPRVIAYSHFGYVGEATSKLEKFKSQTKLWERVAKEGVRAGVCLSEIFETLVEEDPGARELSGIDEEGMRAVYSSLTGFVGYEKWLLKPRS